MTETTTCAGNPDADIIEKLTDAIADVCNQRLALEKRRDAMGKELADLLCPFTEGETVRIPDPSKYAGYKEGILRTICLDLDYGYQMWLVFKDESGVETGWDRVSCFDNTDIERYNGKYPVLPREGLSELLSPLRNMVGGYY